MAFQVRKLDYRPWPVSITLQACQPDGSVIEEVQTFIGHFRRFDEAEVVAIRAEVFGEGTDEEISERAKGRTMAAEGALQAEFYSRLLQGWEGVTDGDGPVPWHVDTFKRLATGDDGRSFLQGVAQAVLEIRFGIAPQKNASSSPAPGPAPAVSAAPTS